MINPENPLPKPKGVKKSAKAVNQVLTAVKNIKKAEGPTMTDIVKFISSSLENPATKRQVVVALKRGVEFGILKKNRGHYVIPTPKKMSKTSFVTVCRGFKHSKGRRQKKKDGRSRLTGKKMAKRRKVTSKRSHGRKRADSTLEQYAEELRDVFENEANRTPSTATTSQDLQNEKLDSDE